MNIGRLKVFAVAASVCATALFASAGSAFASAGPSCTFGSSSGNTQTCFEIDGSGLHVDKMVVSAAVKDSARTLQVCVRGPDSALPFCDAFHSVGPGASNTLVWAPNRNVPAGVYCGRTWRQNNDGSHTLIGEVCFNVHS
jgi:hypothetical protein